MGGLVERFLTEEDCKSPALGAVLSKLRAHAPVLRDRGVIGLWVIGLWFGPVARWR